MGPHCGPGSEGSAGKVDGAFGPEGCVEGLCPQRGNDSLHFARRFAPSSTAVTDSLDFQVADAPLQIQFASAKCVRCASLRSGGRRLAVRTAMEHHIGALPRTPFPASRDFPSRGNEKIGGTGYCVTYDTDS